MECNECGSNAFIRNSDGFLVCIDCGNVCDDFKSYFEQSNSKMKRGEDGFIRLGEIGMMVGHSPILGSVIDPRDGNRYFRRLSKIQTSSLYEEQKKRHVTLYIWINKICNELNLSENTKKYAKEILSNIIKKGESFIERKPVAILSAAIVYKASRSFDISVREKDLFDVIYPKFVSASRSIGDNNEKMTITVNTGEEKITRKKLFRKIIYKLSKIIDTDIDFAIKFFISNVKLEMFDAVVSATKYYNDLYEISRKIYNACSYVGGATSLKIIASVYLASVLYFDILPNKKYFKTNNALIKSMANALNIRLLARANRHAIENKYLLYPNNFRSSYFIIKRKPLENIIQLDENVVDAPYGFLSELGNYYVYRHGNIIGKFNGKRFSMTEKEFVDSLKNVMLRNVCESENDTIVKSLVLEAKLVEIKNGKIEIKYSEIGTNMFLNEYLNSNTVFLKKKIMNKTTRITERGSIKFSDGMMLTIKENKYNEPIITITTSPAASRVYSVTMDKVEKLIEEIVNKKRFTEKDLETLPRRFIVPIIRILKQLSLIESDDENGVYICTHNENEIISAMNGSLKLPSLFP